MTDRVHLIGRSLLAMLAISLASGCTGLPQPTFSPDAYTPDPSVYPDITISGASEILGRTSATLSITLTAQPSTTTQVDITSNDPRITVSPSTVTFTPGTYTLPREVSVVGFDGTPDGEQIWPGLTTVVQPTRRMASAVCRALLDSVERRQPDRSTSVEFAVELLVRESTAAPAR